MVIHKKTFHNKDEKYDCDMCGHQVLQKKSLTGHKKTVHHEVKYPCRQCNKEFSNRRNFARHQQTLHEGVLIPMQAMQPRICF